MKYTEIINMYGTLRIIAYDETRGNEYYGTIERFDDGTWCILREFDCVGKNGEAIGEKLKELNSTE